MNRFNHRFDAHRHFFIHLVPTDQKTETLRIGLAPNVQEPLDKTRVGKFHMIDHTVRLALQCDRGRLACRADPGRPRRVLPAGARHFYLVVHRLQRRHKGSRRRRVRRDVLLA